MRYPIFVAILCTILFSCTDQPKTEAKPQKEVQNPWSLQMERIELKDSECQSEECTYVQLTIPVLSGGETSSRSAINSAIDEAVRESLASKLPEPSGRSSISEMGQKFIEGYKLFKVEFPDTDQTWFAEIDGSESTLSDTIFTLRFNFMDYMGGAHPNTYAYLKSYNLSTGEQVDVSDFIDAGELLQKAEAAFRKEHDLSPEGDLAEAGFMFQNNTFSLPENMALVDGGILLHYNPYEVASYAQGATEIFVEL